MSDVSNLLEDISKLTKKFGRPPSQKRIREAQEFLDLAHQDLMASKVLYDAKIFNLASYHIQQSVEKTAKAYYKLLGILEDKAIRGTSHDTPELFLRMVELPWARRFGEFAKEASDTEMVTDTSEAQSAIDDDAKKAKTARLGSAGINQVLSLIPQIEKGLVPFFSLIHKDGVMALLRLYLLSSVTFPHERYSRYPDEVVKPREYTPKLGLVASMTNVWSETETAISEVQRLIDSARRKKVKG
jgi:HEPN domain-containing protein